MTDKVKLSESEIRERQKRLDEINSSGKYSFKQTVDEYGIIHVDCDAETFIQEMGDITLEEFIRRLDDIENKYVNQNNQ